MTILADIVANRLKEITGLQPELARFQKLAAQAKPKPSFKKALLSCKPALIAEIKKASPSRGVLRADFNPVSLAKHFQEQGASALSVLTEQKYFQGSPDYLKAVSDTVSIPVLWKDFVIDPLQVYQAKAMGASAILLIVAILDIKKFKELLKLATELGLDVLAEVHNEQELGLVLHTRAGIIGINNRNLKTFKIDLATTTRLLPLIPPSKLVVSESGIFELADIPKGVQAVLIGEGLIKNPKLFSL